MTASNSVSSPTHKNCPVLATSHSTQALSLSETPDLANKPVCPNPTKAGVLGIARTMRCVPSHWAKLSLRMPAATLKCSASLQNGPAWPAASRKFWGLTAHTTKSAFSKDVSACGMAPTLNWARRASRDASKGSTTVKFAGETPCLTSPPMMALAILPPPIKAMCGTGASWEVVKEAGLREAVIYMERKRRR